MAIEPGTHFTSLFNADIEIVQLLGSGAQGYVYKILYNGEPKALKIYKKAALKDPKAFYTNIKNNITAGAPSDAFLWPIDLLKWNGKTFGYIMELRPGGYEELSMYVAGSVRFSSFKTAITAALQIVTAFRILHNKGYSYQDLNDGNFFIDPRTGAVLICDNDNVAPNGTSTGILGKPRYMAPEVVRGEARPNTETDRFSLSVILFIMLTLTHPLEGRRYLVDCLVPETEERLYGTEPIFIMDPADRRNAPVQGIHKNIGIIWPELPGYIKDAFTREFSNDYLMKPGRRTTEADWQKLLIRLRSDIIPCAHCGNENFTWNPAAPVCCQCNKPLPAHCTLKLSGCDYPMPILPGNILYRRQLGTADVDQAGKAIAVVRTHPQDAAVLALQNVSGQDVECLTPTGKRKIVPNQGMIPVKPGIILRAYNGTAEIMESTCTGA